jgi:ABC-2 type transport system permease protein
VSPAAAPAMVVPAAASWGRCMRAQLRIELLLLLRQPENLLVILVLPVLLLVFFAGAHLVPAGSGRPVNFLLPGVLTLALMSTGMVTLSISTAYQRYYLVLKRLGASPLSRSGLVAAKAAAVLLVEVAQVVLLAAIGNLGFGWRLGGSIPLALVAMLLGAVMFAAIGLTLAGAVRAEFTLGGANGLYLLFLVIGGVVVPVSRLPGALAAVARLLPPAVLSGCLRSVLAGNHLPGGDFALLVGWTVVAAAAAVALFRWE